MAEKFSDKLVLLAQLKTNITQTKAWVKKYVEIAVSNLKKALKLEDISDIEASATEVNYLTGAKSNIQEQLDKTFNATPVYNSESKKIEFYHDTTKVAELDATAFIKDGMVNTVSIADGKTDGDNNGKKVLLITFNTDSGKEDIEIPLEGIFDASNYYNKTDADNTFLKKTTYESEKVEFVKWEDLSIATDSDIEAAWADED